MVKLAVAVLLMVNMAMAQHYAAPAYAAPAYAAPLIRPARLVEEAIIEPPKPYSFGYNTQDNVFGSTNARQETRDEAGVVRGSYSYTDAQGLYRTVDYIADAAGFRANVRTNEPGTADSNPADAIYESEPSPYIAAPAHADVPVAAVPRPVFAHPAPVPVAPRFHHAVPAHAPVHFGPPAVPIAHAPIAHAPIAHASRLVHAPARHARIFAAPTHGYAAAPLVQYGSR